MFASFPDLLVKNDKLVNSGARKGALVDLFLGVTRRNGRARLQGGADLLQEDVYITSVLELKHLKLKLISSAHDPSALQNHWMYRNMHAF